MKKRIALGADHAGFELKELLKGWLTADYELIDKGCHSLQSVDYPDFAHAVAAALEQQEADLGVLVCGSGQGVAISANKHQAVRAALCWSADIAQLSRAHNDANVLCLPARFISSEEAKAVLEMFLKTPFEGGRHSLRVAKISC